MSRFQPAQSNYYSGFNPLNIPECSLWLDAADTASYTMSGSNLSTWNDKSSNAYVCSPVAGNAITQSTLNGRSVLYFNSTRASIPNFVWNMAHTVFLVTRSTNSQFLYSLWSTGYLDYIYLKNNSLFYLNGNLEYRDSVNAANTAVQTPDAWGTFCIGFDLNTRDPANYTVNGTTRAVTWITGVYPGNISNTATLFINGNGNSGTDTSYVAEIIHYNATLSVAQRQQIEGYLMWKWGIQTNLPSTHPYKSIALVSRPFLPIDVSGCIAWLDATDSTTIALSGSNVTQWNDKSGNGYNAVVNGTTFTYSSNTFNSVYPGITLGTMNITSNFFNLAIPANTFPTGIFGISVFRPTSSTTNYWMSRPTAGVIPRPIDSYSSTTNNWNRRLIGNGTRYWEITMTGGYNFLTQSNTIYYFEANSNASFSWVEFVNGTLSPVTGSLFSNGTVTYSDAVSTNLRIYLQGIHCEHILFNVKPTAFQRQQLEAYLARKWGLATLPSNHQFAKIPPAMPSFLPASIPSCVLWMDSADRSTMTLSGSNVTQWRDKTAGVVFTASPTNPTVSSNSAPIQFGGSAYFSNSSFVYTIPTHTTFVVVGETGAHTNNAGILAFGTSGTDYNRINAKSYNTSFGPGNAYFEIDQAFQAGGFALAFGANIPTPFAVYGDTFGAGTELAYMNGTQVASTTNATTFSNSTGMLIGARSLSGTPSTPITGVIAEILLFSRVLTRYERQQIEGYLTWKWGLQGPPVPGYVTPFTPTGITGCAFWLDGADRNSMTLVGSSVSQWNDKSGNGYNATQSTAGQRPSYLGRGVSFNAASSNNMAISVPYPNSFTLFLVASTSSSTQCYYFGRASSGASGPALIANYTGSSIEYFNSADRATFSASPSSTFLICFTQQLGSRIVGFYNGASAFDIAQTNNANPGVAWSTLGNAHLTTFNAYITGFMYEMLIYNGILTTTQRQQIEGYLANKWGLTGNLPSTHPYANKGLPTTHPYRTIKPY